MPDNKPTHRAYVVQDGKENDKSYWKEIGAAWEHSDGNGLNITLFANPTNGRLTVRKIESSEE